VTTASETLARFAAGLEIAAIPDSVRARAAACIADTVACAVFGSRFPWSAITAAYASRYGAGGRSSVFGSGETKVSAPFAAFANGASAHAFEQDSLRFPGTGVHPGATLVPALAAACEETGADGATALRAFVAGCEVLFRIGLATRHSSEKLGFHAPGLTGPYGAAVAAGIVYGLDASGIARALGIAGSLSAGLLAFTKSRDGAMVKRLHMGRACEAGVLAARLAADGYTGPETILEGRFGFLEAYSRDSDAAQLTAGLGNRWETLNICFKRYPCHVTAQAAMQALRQAMIEQRFDAGAVTALLLECSEKVASHHDIRSPSDVMMAQYSVPFCVALAMHRDPEDPRSFDDSALSDAGIARTCASIEIRAASGLPSAWSARMTVSLSDGRRLEILATSFRGMPDDPLTDADMRRRFLLMTRELGEERSATWHDKLSMLWEQPRFPAL
jgi:2-methylcitrate dehydratase PrpD